MVYKTPGVYILEKDAFPNSVVEVATAVPAFVGYTEKAENKGASLANKPFRITSMTEFIDYFGGAPVSTFDLTAAEGPARPAADAGAAADAAAGADPGAAPAKPAPAASDDDVLVPDTTRNDGGKKRYVLTESQDSTPYLLYRSMQLFYLNGGGPCYVVSVGGYSDAIDGGMLKDGIELLRKEQEPTMLVIPEAMRLKDADCISLQQQMLAHCGEVMKNRFAILDIHDGFRDRRSNPDPVAAFRDQIGVNNLAFGAAYYPWLATSIVSEGALSFTNLASQDALKTLLTEDMRLDDAHKPPEDDPLAAKSFKDKQDKVAAMDGPWDIDNDKYKSQEDVARAQRDLHEMYLKFSPAYATVMSAIARRLNLMPPAAAMAGIYTSVDNGRGVWKAPANVSVNAVVQPAVSISHAEQEDLNVTATGKSVNAIRTFFGAGVLVWGARTLLGNSLDWRYINVRRTMIMLEESLRLAMAAYVFEPNVANTWVTVKSMANNFLTGIWKRGGLAGAAPADAFAVFVGLGETMTPEDILEGRMNMTILVALSRPAEFIEITFQQQMQKS